MWDRQGTVVAARLATAGGAVPEAARRIVREAAEAIAALHNAGIVHGALTARAVSVDEESGRVVIGDVGLRHLVDGGALELAPEQASGAAPTVASDGWALGALLSDLVTTPTTSGGGSGTEEASAATARARPSRSTRPLPEALAPIVARATAEAPGDRYPDARAFAEALAAARLGGAGDDDLEELTLAPGTILDGRWRVVRTLGAGGMGAVVEAEHTVLGGKRAALKLLHPDLARDPDMAARFLREAQTAARLRHPNVVSVEDVLEDPKYGPIMVMELLEGEPLDRLIPKGPLPLARARAIAEEALAALEAAHAAGIVHRDVKPGNFLLCRGGDGKERVKLLDFGIARTLEGSSLTAPGQFLGTRRYAAPEQVSDSSSADRAADLFSFGAVLFELFTARAFRSTTMGAPEGYVDRTLAAAAVPAPLADVVKRAIAREPGARFESAGALRAALRSAFDAVGGSAPATPAPPTNLPLDKKAPQRGGALAAGLALVAVAGAGVVWWRMQGTPTAPAAAVAPKEPAPAAATPASVPTAEALRAPCRMLAKTLYGLQHPDGGFAATPHDPTSGSDTAQPLTALVRARRVCHGLELADELRALDALVKRRGPHGWTNLAVQDRAGYPSTVGAAWATLAFTLAEPDGATAPSPRLGDARRVLAGAQHADGGFPLALGPGADRATSAYPSVLATWALVESEPPAADEATAAPRKRALAWLRAAMRADGAGALRATPGVADHALFTLARARARLHDEDAGDATLLATFARDLVDRCALDGTPRACTRSPAANGRNVIKGITAKQDELFVSYWWPWTAAAATALARDAALPEALRRDLSDIATGQARGVLSTAGFLASMPSYELSEHLLGVTLLVEYLAAERP